jgi:hypothetical protein
MLRIVQECFNEKVANVLDSYKVMENKDIGKEFKAVLLFNHGLGDFVLFLPLFDKLCKMYPEWDLYVGCNPERNFKYLHPKCVIMDGPYGKYEGIYNIIFNIIYPEPPRNENELIEFNNKFHVDNIEKITKPYLCNILEIGLDEFEWKPYKFGFELNNKESKRIGVHFFGHTSIQNKDASYETAEFIWNQIIKAGFEPFEVQMLPIDVIQVTETPNFIGDRTIRYNFPNLRIMCNAIQSCKSFIGVDSGPIYLAGTILGFDKVLGLERNRKFNKVCPEMMNVLNIENYRGTEIIDFLNGLK